MGFVQTDEDAGGAGGAGAANGPVRGARWQGAGLRTAGSGAAGARDGVSIPGGELCLVRAGCGGSVGGQVPGAAQERLGCRVVAEVPQCLPEVGQCPGEAHPVAAAPQLGDRACQDAGAQGRFFGGRQQPQRRPVLPGAQQRPRGQLFGEQPPGVFVAAQAEQCLGRAGWAAVAAGGRGP